jgi:ABC-2 type transport system ATP-binding protein
VLQAAGLRRSYGGRTVVYDFTATVDPGEIVVLVGPNGCGKTTSVEMALGLRRTEHGQSRLLGYDAVRDRRAVVSDIGVMLQNASLHARVRLSEQLQYLEAVYGAPGVGMRVAHELGLTDVLGQQYGVLSGGLQRRALLATALVGSPRLAVLDEPTSGIDLESRLKIWTVLRSQVVTAGAGMLITSHNLLEAEHQADRVIVMREGVVIASGAPKDLIAAAGIPFVVVVRSTDLPAIKLTGIPLHSSDVETTIGFTTEGEAKEWAVECEQLPGTPSPTVRAATLEDVYLALAAQVSP